MNKSTATQVVPEVESPTETWDRHRFWLPILWLPVLWSSVWCVVVGLVFWERRLADVDLPVAQLGWLPVFVATLLMSLYLQWQQRVAIQSLRSWLLYVRLVQYVVWVAMVWYLGGWENGMLALLVLLAGELHSCVLMLSRDLVPASSFAGSLPNGSKKVETELESSESNLAEELSPEVAVTRAESPLRPVQADEEIDKEFEADPELDEEELDEEELDEEELDEEELDRHELDKGQVDALGEASSGLWRQQMTRRGIDSVTPLMSQSEEVPLREEIEWFGRHTWRAGQVQVDLHVPFQPAFLDRPDVQVAVVEGVGQAIVGDVLPHGARVQLKRAKLEENAKGTTAVWLQATGPVES